MVPCWSSTKWLVQSCSRFVLSGIYIFSSSKNPLEARTLTLQKSSSSKDFFFYIIDTLKRKKVCLTHRLVLLFSFYSWSPSGLFRMPIFHPLRKAYLLLKLSCLLRAAITVHHVRGCTVEQDRVMVKVQRWARISRIGTDFSPWFSPSRWKNAPTLEKYVYFRILGTC